MVLLSWPPVEKHLLKICSSSNILKPFKHALKIDIDFFVKLESKALTFIFKSKNYTCLLTESWKDICRVGSREQYERKKKNLRKYINRSLLNRITQASIQNYENKYSEHLRLKKKKKKNMDFFLQENGIFNFWILKT